MLVLFDESHLIYFTKRIFAKILTMTNLKIMRRNVISPQIFDATFGKVVPPSIHKPI